MTDQRLRRHPFGFLEVVDRPSAAELSAYYADRYYQNERGSFRRDYAPEERHAISLRIAQRATRAEALLECSGPARLLDVGCGEGFVLADFASRGWEVAGMDFSIAGVEAMNSAMVPYVRQGDLFDLLDAEIASQQTYDLVWLGNVLEHVLDPIGLLESLGRLLTPSGILVVTIPNDGSPYQEDLFEAGLIDRRFWIAIPDHLSYFDISSFRSTAQATGWDVLDILGDFPIDLFLAHPGSNYVMDPSLGPLAHAARLRIEAIVGRTGLEAANRFYSAMADVGLGRNITAFLRLPTAKDNQA
jgi:SAM-dependent methyltransferase